MPGAQAPIVLAHDTPELQLLQRVRDEAHRFAIDPPPHPPRQGDDDVDPRRAAAASARRASARCCSHFGSPEAVLAASREELEAVPGLPGKVARELYAQLNRTGDERPLIRSDACDADRSARDCDNAAMAIEARLRLATGCGATTQAAADGTRLAPRGPRRHHRLLRRRQVDGDGRLRGRGLLLRRQPAAGDDPLARRAVHARGLEGRARGGRLRRARRRVLRGAASTVLDELDGAGRRATACCSSTPTSRRC